MNVSRPNFRLTGVTNTQDQAWETYGHIEGREKLKNIFNPARGDYALSIIIMGFSAHV